MFYRFLLSIFLALPFASFAASIIAENPAKLAKPAPNLPSLFEENYEENDDESTGFIEKGKTSLPVAPEVIQSMADREVPENVISEPSKKELAEAPKEQKSNEDKLLERGLAELFSEDITPTQNPEEQGFSNHLANKLAEKGLEGEIVEEDGNLDLSIANKATEKNIKDIAQEIQNTIEEEAMEAKISKNKDGSIHIETPNKQEPTQKTEEVKVITNKPAKKEENAVPALPTLASKIPAYSSKKVEPAKPKKVIQIKKKMKEDLKLKRFVRDESIFILFKDDDIVLGNLTEDAKFEQMSGREFLNLYEEQKKRIAGIEGAKKMDQFIASRSFIENPDLPDKYLTKAIRQEIINSNLTDLRTLDDNYEIIDLADEDGNTALHIASYENNAAITKWLIMRGAMLHPINEGALTPMEIAGFKGNWQIFDMIERASNES